MCNLERPASAGCRSASLSLDGMLYPVAKLAGRADTGFQNKGALEEGLGALCLLRLHWVAASGETAPFRDYNLRSAGKKHHEGYRLTEH